MNFNAAGASLAERIGAVQLMQTLKKPEPTCLLPTIVNLFPRYFELRILEPHPTPSFLIELEHRWDRLGVFTPLSMCQGMLQPISTPHKNLQQEFSAQKITLTETRKRQGVDNKAQKLPPLLLPLCDPQKQDFDPG